MSGFTMEYTTSGASESVTLPLVTGYTYDCQVIWDGEAPVSVTAWDDAGATHVQTAPGTYQVEITGACPGWSVNNTHSSKLQWTAIIDHGDPVDFDGFEYLVGMFFRCTNLTGSINGILDNSPLLTNIINAWYDCRGLTGTINGILDNSPLLTNIYGAWYGCSGLTGTINGILDNCPLIATAGYAWFGCSGLTGTINGILDNCPLLATIYAAWYGCSGLTGTIDGILANCPLPTDFNYTWYGCSGLQYSPWAFYADGEQSTRFLNKSVSFISCFHRTSTTAPQGQAPDLWNCDFGTGTPTTTNCFAGAGNSLSSLINYNNIPTAWGGPATTTPPEIVSVDKSTILHGNSITLTGTDFEASGGTFYLCDENNLATATAVTQTISQDSTTVYVSFLDIDTITPGTYWIYFKDSGDQISNSWELTVGEEPSTHGFIIDCETTGTDESVTLPFVTGYTYDCTVNWDGTDAAVTAWNDTDATKIYHFPGKHRIEIKGTCPGWSINNTHSSMLQWTDIIYWGDAVDFDGFAYLTGGFYGCLNLKSFGTGSILATSGLTDLRFCFRFCILPTSIESAIFSNLVDVVNFESCFNGCTGILAIPAGLFDNNIAATSFWATFSGCSGLVGDYCIPSGLFDNNVNMTSAGYCFRLCNMASIPDGLFKYNPSLVTLPSTFYECRYLKYSPWVFYDDGEQSTRFLNRSIDFSSCFPRLLSFSSEGQAPDLWNCDFGTGTPTTTNCFSGAGNSLASLINYNNIPTAWGGPATTTPPWITSFTPDLINQGGISSGIGTDLGASGGALWLCDENNLATATKVAQSITHDATSIALSSFDVGSFENGDCWLYFVDSDDQISQGYPVRIDIGKILYLFVTNSNGVRNSVGFPVKVYET